METQTIDIDSVKLKLKEIISGELDINIGIDEIDENISLYEDGVGLDSISLVNFIVLMEQKFNISFSEEDINIELFSSINNLAAFISARTGESRADS